MKKIHIAISQIFLALAIATGSGQAIDLGHYKAQGKFYADKLKPLILESGGLNADEHEAIQQTSVVIREGWAVQGFAQVEYQTKSVIIYAGAVALIDWIAQALALEEMYHDEGFANRYVTYASGIIEQNTQYYDMGSVKRVALKTPAKAIADGDVPSSLIDPHAPFSQEARDQVRSLTETSFVYLLFHEFGHIAKKHGEQGMSISLEQKRVQETEADEWSVVHALNCEFNVSTALPMFVLFGQVDNETEKLMDHPAGQKRVVSTLKVIKRKLLDGHPMSNKYKADGSFDRILAGLDQEISIIQKQSESAE